MEKNGTTYNDKTPIELAELLEDARITRSRVRIWYGDTETGRDWLEENDITGRVGRSTGTEKIPLIVNNSRSMGGPGLLDHCIVKLAINKTVVWQHEKYQTPRFIPTKEVATGMIKVYEGEKLHALFDNKEKAKRWIAFMLGERWAK